MLRAPASAVAKVALLSRSIVVEGDESSTAGGFGAHCLIGSGTPEAAGEGARTSSGRFRHVEFRRMGQFNRGERFPLQWIANGDSTASCAIDCLIHQSFQRGVVVAGSPHVRLAGNVVYKPYGHAYVIEHTDDAAQMIAIRIAEAEGEGDRERLTHDVFSERFLIKRPLLQALEPDPAGPPVLLIDELDRSDEAFEAYLLEVLADFQITIPELGTIKAAKPPIVVITSNRTREIHDALKRRCLYHWVGYPSAARELEIVRRKVPGIGAKLSAQVVGFVQALRKEDLFKAPGVAETLDWAQALVELDAVALDPAVVSDTLGVLLKYQDDIARLEGSKVKEILDQVQAELRAAE